MRAELHTVDSLNYGRLSLTAHPRGGDWLADEIAAFKAAGVDALVSLLTPEETSEFGLSEEASLCQAQAILFVSFPIEDMDVPYFDVETLALLERLQGLLLEGKHIVVHCRMGVGRSGLIASSLLVLNGYTPQQAFDLLSHVRGLTIPDTEEQEAWVVTLYKRIQTEKKSLE